MKTFIQYLIEKHEVVAIRIADNHETEDSGDFGYFNSRGRDDEILEVAINDIESIHPWMLSRKDKIIGRLVEYTMYEGHRFIGIQILNDRLEISPMRYYMFVPINTVVNTEDVVYFRLDEVEVERNITPEDNIDEFMDIF